MRKNTAKPKLPWALIPAASHTEIRGSQRELKKHMAKFDALRFPGRKDRHRRKNPLQFVPETPTQLLRNQPRLIENLDTLSKLTNFCEDRAENGQVSLKDVRRCLADEIDAVIAYFVTGLGFTLRAGRPKMSEDNQLVRFTRTVNATIAECHPLVRFAWKNLSPRMSESRIQECLKKAGYKQDQIVAYLRATINKRTTGKMSTTQLNSLTKAAAIELVTIREGLPDPEPVYRAVHECLRYFSRPKDKLDAPTWSEGEQKLASALQE